MRKKKAIRLGSGVLISIIIAGLVLAGLIFCQLSSQGENKASALKQKADLAYTDKNYPLALKYWLNIPEEERTTVVCLKIGTTYLKLANLKQATLFYEKALEKSPENPVIQRQFIRICLLNADMDKADKILSTLNDRAASDPKTLLLSADLFLLKGDLEKAKTNYTRAMSLSPGKIRPQIKLAICLLQQQNKNQAEKIMANVVSNQLHQLDTTSKLMLAADYYILSGDMPKAEAFIKKAVQTDPGDLDIKIRLCRFYRAAGMQDKAASYLEELVGQYPDNVGFKLMSADICLSRMDMQKAQAWLDKARSLKEDDTGYQLLMGKFWLFQGRYSHAEAYLKTALERNYGLLSAHYLLGITYLAGGQRKLAETSLVRALMIDPDNVDALLAMAGLHYKTRNYPLALQYIDKILSEDSSESTAWQIKGLCLVETGEYKKAAQAFSRAWHLDGKASALFFLACSFEKQKLYQAALDTCETILETAPDMVDALHLYAWLLADMGKAGQALDMVDLWLEKGINLPGVYYAGAKISLKIKDYSRCQAYLEKAMTDQSASGPFYLLKADLLSAQNNHAGIEETLVACTRQHHRFPDGWRCLAAFYMSQYKITAAKEVLEKAIKQFPDDPEIMGNLAWLLLEEESDPDRALALARKAYDILPDQAWLMDTLGWAYYHKHVYGQAGWMLSQAREKAPDNGTVQYHLGMTLYKQGKLLKAKEALEPALANKNLKTEEKEKIEEVLAGLSGHKKEEKLDITIFDPDKPSAIEFPGISDQEQDILKPDWSNMER